MTRGLDDARAELRKRQGPGARYDAAAAPGRELDWARRGTAYFARMLNSLDDREFDEVSLVAGVPRRLIVAYVALEGRLLAELIGSFRAGNTSQKPASPVPAPDRLCNEVSLPVRALRNLFAHAAVHLDVEWRDLDDAQWDGTVECENGDSVTIRETPRRRALSIWTAGLDLGPQGRPSDLPHGLAPLLAANRSIRESLRLRYRLADVP